MKKSLQVASGCLFLLFQAFTSNGQTTILAENFSGFATGTHSVPSTNDVSSALDSRTSVPGWKGNLVYSAGGEIKVGTSSLTGWIETPVIDLSLNDGKGTVAFDIARWTGDATTVQVYLDGMALGAIISPSDNFERTEIPVTSGTFSSRIRIQSLSKRFYIDNFSVTTESLPTAVDNLTENVDDIMLWPVPVAGVLNIANSAIYDQLIICDITGRILKRISINREERLKIDLTGFDPGVYLLTFISGKTRKLAKVIKQ